ncbi:MAG: DNA helicase RecG, partial [Candidatus Magasanikbacteria bacterium]|nr:DNA helicase RecG [Candidatus Magasanikbacteria bacterium]
EGAERFGLAQLHQFRGRVGRAEHQSYCLVFSETDSEKSLERLHLFEKERNGFVLAEKDLEMRGPGEVFGTAQSGMMHLKLARLTDRALIQKSRDIARWIFEKDATLARWPTIAAYFETWQHAVHLE